MVEYESTRGTGGSSEHAHGGAGFFRDVYEAGSDDEDCPQGQRVECNTH